MSVTSDGTQKSKAKTSGWWYRFKQQDTPAWTPKYTVTSVSPLLIAFGLLLVPLGIVILVISSDGSDDMKEIHVDYTNCPSVANPSRTCADIIKTKNWADESSSEACECEVEFELTKPIKGKKLYMYYTIKNFHQNLRKYGSSKDESQLNGEVFSSGNPISPSKDCEPLDKDPDGNVYYPCGSIANSMFNDSIQLYFNDSTTDLVKVEQQRRGIAWSTDLKYRFKNPEEFKNLADPVWTKIAKLPDWSRQIWELDPEDPENNGVQNEDFVVWMRPAAFSNFQKLYRIIEASSQAKALEDGLPAGKYHLRINYNYEVTSFKGEKGVLLTATTVFGVQNYFQGITSISVGGISLVMGLTFLLCGCRRRLGKGGFGKSENAHL